MLLTVLKNSSVATFLVLCLFSAGQAIASNVQPEISAAHTFEVAPEARFTDSDQVIEEVSSESSFEAVNVVDAAFSQPLRFKLSGIVFIHLSVFEPLDLLPTYRHYLGKEIGLKELKSIASKVTAMYRQRDKMLAYVLIPKQSVTAGIVRLEIVEAKISRLKIEGDFRGSSTYLKSFFNIDADNSHISLYEMRHGLLLLNNLPGLSATADVQLIESLGDQLELKVEVKQKRFSGGLSLDNRGTELMGEEQALFSVNSYSALAQFEQIQLRMATTVDKDELEYYALNTHWPVGPYGSQAVLSVSSSNAEPGGFLEPLSLTFENMSVDLGFIWSLNKSVIDETQLSVIVNYYQSDNWLDNQKLLHAELYTLDMGLTHIARQYRQYYSRFSIQLQTSLQGLNEIDDLLENTVLANGREDYSLVRVSEYFEDILNQHWALGYLLKAQYADDSLPASRQFIFGGADIGVAYDPAELIGDHGLAFKVQLQYQLKQVYIPGVRSWLYGVYDVGRVWNISLEERRSAASVGLGYKIGSESIFASVELVKPLTRPVLLEEDDGKDVRLFASLKYYF